MVRNEIIQMIKGMLSATLCPSISLYLAQNKLSHAYCGWAPSHYSFSDTSDSTYDEDIGMNSFYVKPYSLIHHIIVFVIMWVASDFWEFYYHRLGHTTKRGWEQHKYHHHFYNPSPFAVIADEYIDQFVRALPLLLFPLIAPVNIDVLFFEFGLFFYGYGVYLHWGYELEWLDAHHPHINTSFQHYLHHAVSIKNKPYHTGFFVKWWDRLFGSIYLDKCFCAKCERAAGKRTLEQYNNIMKIKPDYSCLLSVKFWLSSEKEKETVKDVSYEAKIDTTEQKQD